MPKIPSLDKLFYDFKNSISKYLQRDDIVLSPGFPITDLMVSLPLQEIRRLYLLLEFLYRTQTPNSILALLEDSDFIQEFCNRFELTENEFRTMVMDEVVRKAFPFQPNKGTPAYIVMKIQVFTNESSILLRRTDLQLEVAGHVFNLAIPEDGIEFLISSDGGNNYVEVPFYSEDYGFKVSEIVKPGSYYPVKLNYYQNLFDTKGYVIYSIDGGDPESLESFVDRLSVFPRFGYNLSLVDIISNLLKSFGVSDFKVVTYGEQEFSPRPYGIDVWVRVPYIPVKYDSTSLKIGPDPKSHYSYDSDLGGGLPPRMSTLYGSIYDYSNDGTFNPLVFRIQSFLTSNSIFAGNSLGILVRKADAIYLKKIKLIGLVPKGGYSTSFVVEDLKKDLHKFLSNQNIGVSISSSDILRVVLNNAMVDDCSGAAFISYLDSPDSTGEGIPFNNEDGISYIKVDKVSQYVSVVDLDKFVVTYE